MKNFPLTQFLQLKFKEIPLDNLDPSLYYVNKKDGFIQDKKIKNLSVKSTFLLKLSQKNTTDFN